MMQIYTDYSNFDMGKVIVDNDYYFYEHITASMLDDIGKEVIKIIDGAELIDINIGTVKTKRGVTSIDNLSTGAKTVLNYLYCNDNIEVINITQCGWNAIDCLINAVEKSGRNMKFVLKHRDELYRCKEGNFLINGRKKITNLLYL